MDLANGKNSTSSSISSNTNREGRKEPGEAMSIALVCPPASNCCNT